MKTPNTAPGLHVAQLHFVTDHALPSDQAQALGSAFTFELDAALQAAGASPHSLRINELVVEAPARQLNDRGALRQLALAAAQRILTRLQE